MADWKNVTERLISTTWQAAVGALAGALTALDFTGGAVDWRAALVTVGTAAALSFGKNLVADLTAPTTPTGTTTPATAPVVNTADGPVTPLK